LPSDRLVDTLMLARRKHPAGPNSLDALCKRYGIDNSERTKHGALLDALLLSNVYVELLGERQATLGLRGAGANDLSSRTRSGKALQRPQPLAARINAEVEAAHRAFVESLGPGALWFRYMAAS
jgi:DNA polymerase-3 subunit epsilon